MRALRLDYRRRINGRQLAGRAALLLVSLAAGDRAVQYSQLALETEAVRAELERHAAPPRALKDPRQGKGLEAEMERARDVLLNLDVPWLDLFGAVEASTNAEVALLGIEPEPKREQVRIIGEAKSYPAVLDYARRLEVGAPLSSVHLQSHQVQVQDPERPVRFVIGAAWRRRS